MRRGSTELLAAVLWSGTVIGGCGPGPLDPAGTGGELLRGTGGVAYLGGDPFSISPDHRWLVFSSGPVADASRAAGPVSHERAQLGAYVAYDLWAGAGRSVSVGEDVAERIRSGGGVLLDGGCWVSRDVGHRVLLRDAFGRAIGFDPGAEAPTWESVDMDRHELRASCPLEDAIDAPSELRGAFRIEGAGSRAVRIVDAQDASRIYAVHSAPPISTGILVSDLRLSPRGRRLAYSVRPALGSFVSNARAFLVDADDISGSPTALAAPVLSLRWGPDGSALYAVVEGEETTAIYRWAIGELRHLSSFEEGVRVTARVVDNVTGCLVDALCQLTLELVDTTVMAIYGGERPAPACSTPVAASDLAFRLQPGDTVDVRVAPCSEEGQGLFVEDVAR